MPPSISVVGRFPPPLDGQAVATATLADLLDRKQGGPLAVEKFNLSAPEEDIREDVSALARMRHYVGAGSRLRSWASRTASGPVLWPAVSPSPLGHLRDVGTILPALGNERDVYAIVHRGDFHTLFEHPLTRWTAPRMVRRLSGIVFNTPGLAERCARWVPPEKRLTMRNTVGPDVQVSPEAASAKTERQITGRPVRLLYLSGMIQSKGYIVVLETVAELMRRGVAVEATFAGRWPGPEAERDFWSRATASGAANSIRHLGGVSDRGAVRQLYLDADLFLLPTTYPVEAQPVTIVEALNAATPVLSTRHASIPEMIEDGVSGLLAAPEAAPLADAVERASAPATWNALSKGARARYDERFAPGVVRTAWLDLLGLSVLA